MQKLLKLITITLLTCNAVFLCVMVIFSLLFCLYQLAFGQLEIDGVFANEYWWEFLCRGLLGVFIILFWLSSFLLNIFIISKISSQNKVTQRPKKLTKMWIVSLVFVIILFFTAKEINSNQRIRIEKEIERQKLELGIK